jgi:glutamine amidotransferase-like uncharacterized protein
MAFGISFQIILPAFTAPTQFSTEEAEVIIFHPGSEHGSPRDIATFTGIATFSELSVRTVDYRFINKRESFFDDSGKRRFKVLIMGGGEGHNWFRQALSDPGLSCTGVKNIMNFIESGGSVIAICICDSALFASEVEWLNPSEEEAQMGLWNRKQSHPGHFKRLCGFSALKGLVRGPQETNRPYPKKLFLPIRMNLENEIVRGANLPAIIPQIVVGSGSLFPDRDQPFDIIGWYRNGTIAMGVVPYGAGRVILSNPHPNQNGLDAARSREKSINGKHASKWGWTDEMMKEMLKVIEENPVPSRQKERDSWNLAKAMLLYAYRKASQ